MEVLSLSKMEEQRRILSSINTKPWLVIKFKIYGDYKFADIYI